MKNSYVLIATIFSLVVISLWLGWMLKTQYDIEMTYRHKAALYDQGNCSVDVSFQKMVKAASQSIITHKLPLNKPHEKRRK
jgi:hypothetical protein